MFPILDYKANETRTEGFLPWIDVTNTDLSKNAYFERGFYYTRNDDHGMFAGEAVLRAFDAEAAALPVELFLIVVEGELTVTDAQGRVTKLGKNETAAFPRGLRAKWTQPAGTRIHFMLYSDGATEVAADDSLEVIVPQLDETLGQIDGPAAELILTEPRPTVGRKIIYTGAEGRFTVGLWEATSYTRKLAAFGDYELMYFIQGEVEMTNAIGEARTFQPHEAFLVNRGVSNAWKTTDYIRKVYCKVSPQAAA